MQSRINKYTLMAFGLSGNRFKIFFKGVLRGNIFF